MYEITFKKAMMSAVAASALSATAASAQEACSNYSVVDGDTLATISIAAYGTTNYQPIFNANRNIIVNPNDLEQGLVLALPCEDGSLPNGQSAREVIAAQEERNASNRVSNVYQPPIKIVTGGNWAPFAEESLSNGGMMARLATTALGRAGNSADYSVSFVDDWGSHLSTLLPLGAFDVSLAWYLPDCSNRTYEWGENTTMRCTEFVSSVPVYESVIGFYTLPDSKYAGATSYEDFHGSTLCRNEGTFTFDLEEQGLVEPNITFVRPPTPQGCMEGLLNGSIDVATYEIEVAATVFGNMQLEANAVAENPFLNNVLALHFFAHRTNPFGRKYIALLNKGLNEMRETGEWYAIVSDTLREHNENIIAASN